MPSSQQFTEDESGRVSPFTARIHRTCQSYYLRQAIHRAVAALTHQRTNGAEELEVSLFAREQRETSKVWDHSLKEWLETSCLPLHRPIAPIRPKRAAAEVVPDQKKNFRPVRVLAYGHTWSHLPTH